MPKARVLEQFASTCLVARAGSFQGMKANVDSEIVVQELGTFFCLCAFHPLCACLTFLFLS